MKIKFNLDDELPLNKVIEIPTMHKNVPNVPKRWSFQKKLH